jgi:hypothetical protein
MADACRFHGPARCGRAAAAAPWRAGAHRPIATDKAFPAIVVTMWYSSLTPLVSVTIGRSLSDTFTGRRYDLHHKRSRSLGFIRSEW